MTSTEMLPARRFATNRIADVCRKLEQSKPLADRLAKESTAELTLYSDEPRSTWGFNPFSPPKKATSTKYCSGSYFSQVVTCIIGTKFLDVLTQLNKKPAPETCAQVLWYKNPEEYHHWFSDADASYTLTSGCFHGLWAPQVEQAAVTPVVTEQPEPAVEAEADDHLEPVTFGWTRSGFAARAAARRFSENVHGDY